MCSITFLTHIPQTFPSGKATLVRGRRGWQLGVLMLEPGYLGSDTSSAILGKLLSVCASVPLQ